MKKTISFLIILISGFQIDAQDYNKVDSVVSNFPKNFKSIKEFAHKINVNFTTDLEKTRAAYYWISNNIAYDFESLKKGKNKYKNISYDTKSEYQAKLAEMEKRLADKVLRKKRAVCEGYSQLLKFTLLHLNIECEVIHGYAKKYEHEIGRKRNGSNHAWNCVKLNGKWELIDATWSTGFSDNNEKYFKFDDIYFLIKPEKMILNHFPNKNELQFLNPYIIKEDFFLKPVISSDYFNSGLSLNDKTKGIFRVKKNDSITLFFDKADENRFYSYALKEDKHTTLFLFEKKEDKYLITIPINIKRNTMLTIYNSEGYALLDFKIIIER